MNMDPRGLGIPFLGNSGEVDEAIGKVQKAISSTNVSGLLLVREDLSAEMSIAAPIDTPIRNRLARIPGNGSAFKTVGTQSGYIGEHLNVKSKTIPRKGSGKITRKSVETIRQIDINEQRMGHVGERRNDIDWSHLEEDYRRVRNGKKLAYLYGTTWDTVRRRMVEQDIPYGHLLRVAWNKGLTKETSEGVKRIAEHENHVSWIKNNPKGARRIGRKGLSSMARKRTQLEVGMKKLFKRSKIKFIEQYRIGKYVVDFLLKRKVVVECDGEYFHEKWDAKITDGMRDFALREKGYEVLRFSGKVISNPQMSKDIVRTIQKCVERRRNDVSAKQKKCLVKK